MPAQGVQHQIAEGFGDRRTLGELLVVLGLGGLLSGGRLAVDQLGFGESAEEALQLLLAQNPPLKRQHVASSRTSTSAQCAGTGLRDSASAITARLAAGALASAASNQAVASASRPAAANALA